MGRSSGGTLPPGRPRTWWVTSPCVGTGTRSTGGPERAPRAPQRGVRGGPPAAGETEAVVGHQSLRGHRYAQDRGHEAALQVDDADVEVPRDRGGARGPGA